jgi:hypothetical protein
MAPRSAALLPPAAGPVVAVEAATGAPGRDRAVEDHGRARTASDPFPVAREARSSPLAFPLEIAPSHLRSATAERHFAVARVMMLANGAAGDVRRALREAAADLARGLHVPARPAIPQSPIGCGRGARVTPDTGGAR